MDSIVNEIITGCRIIYPKIDGAPIFVCKGVSGKDRLISEIHYNKALSEAKENGLPLKEDLLKTLEFTGEWTKAHDRRIEDIKKNINHNLSELKLAEYQLGKKKLLHKKVDNLKEQLTKLESRRDLLLSMSAENYALEYKYFWCLHKLIYTLDGAALWPTYEDFLADNPDKIYLVNIEYMRTFYLPLKEIRRIARSGIWRVLFKSCDNSRDLFDRPLCDLDDNQINLLYWSQVYDNVFQAIEPPSDDVVENDDAFDGWLKDYSDKISKDRAKSRSGTGSSSASLSEIFTVTDEAGADKFYKDVGAPSLQNKKEK